MDYASDTSVSDVIADFDTTLNQSVLQGALNELLRRRLDTQASPPAVTSKPDKDNVIVNLALKAASAALQSNSMSRADLLGCFKPLYEKQKQIYMQAAIPRELRKRQYIAAHGLVISPDNCITSILDVLRLRAYIRGLDQALRHLQENKCDDGAIHLVYPACGPFAPLLFPLLAYYQNHSLYGPDDLQVTLIDMQQGAVISLQAMVKAMGLSDYIHDIQCKDAMDYQSRGPVHVVLLEAMQHGFSREGHLALAQHFAKLLEPEGIMIPEKITIRAVLNIGQREFVDQWNQVSNCEWQNMSEQVLSERTELGEVLTIDLAVLRDMHFMQLDEHTQILECESIALPNEIEQVDKQLLLICSDVYTYADETVAEYDSGITHPLPDEQICIGFAPAYQRPGDLLVQPGDTLKFYYRLNGLPGFFTVKQQATAGQA